MKIIHIVIAIGVLISTTAYSQVFDVPYKDDAPTRTLLTPVKNAKAVVLISWWRRCFKPAG
jgi:hypothetical protein